MRVEVINVSGNIGSGKTSLLEGIKAYYTSYAEKRIVNVILEPVQEWDTALKLFYQELEKPMPNESILQERCIDLQKTVLKSYEYIYSNLLREIINYQALKNYNAVVVYVIERGPLDSAEFFIPLLQRNDYICTQYAAERIKHIKNKCKKLHRTIANRIGDSSMNRVFLTDTPEDCFERLQKYRETNSHDISLEYLKDLDCVHKEAVARIKKFEDSPGFHACLPKDSSLDEKIGCLIALIDEL